MGNPAFDSGDARKLVGPTCLAAIGAVEKTVSPDRDNRRRPDTELDSAARHDRRPMTRKQSGSAQTAPEAGAVAAVRPSSLLRRCRSGDGRAAQRREKQSRINLPRGSESKPRKPERATPRQAGVSTR